MTTPAQAEDPPDAAQPKPLKPAKDQSASEPEAKPAPPETCCEVLARISAATRPQWRACYRTDVNHTLPSREKAALAAGALAADLLVAAEIRDGQQVRNLLLETEALDRHLGIEGPLASSRQRLVVAADGSDWKGMRTEVDSALRHRQRLLREQKDEPLAELLDLGKWVRILHCSVCVVAARGVEHEALAVGDPAIIAALSKRAAELESAAKDDKSLRLLARRLAAVEKLWSQPASDPAARLARTQELLDELVARLIQDEPAKPEKTDNADPTATPGTPGSAETPAPAAAPAE